MKKLSLLSVLVVLAILSGSCKKEDSSGELPPLNISNSDAAKVATLLREATDLFNTNNKITASVKADQARAVFNGAMLPGRTIIVSNECPLTYLQGDDSMMILGLACGEFMHKRPANVPGTFNEHMMLFNVTLGSVADAQGPMITEKKIADMVKAAQPGTMFSATMRITDPGVLLEAQEGFLYSHSMSYNVKVLEIKRAGK